MPDAPPEKERPVVQESCAWSPEAERSPACSTRFTEMVPAAGVVLGMGLPQSAELSTGPRGAAVLSPG